MILELALFAAGAWIYLRSSPPPAVRPLAWAALSLVLLVFWAGWADAHRRPRAPGR